MHTDRRRRVEEEEKNRERADVYLSQEEEDEKWKYLSNSLISFRIRVIFILIKEYFYQVLLGDKKKLKKNFTWSLNCVHLIEELSLHWQNTVILLVNFVDCFYQAYYWWNAWIVIDERSDGLRSHSLLINSIFWSAAILLVSFINCL